MKRQPNYESQRVPAGRLRIAVACSGLGHVARGVEAWASDLGRALADRGENVVLCKGGGVAEAPYERVFPCWQRAAARAQKISRWTRRGLWRIYLGSSYQWEEASFTWHLLKLLRRESIDILHVQDPHIALFVQRANRLGWVRTRAILGNGTNEPYNFLNKITYLHHLAPFYLEQARSADCGKPTWTTIPNFIDPGAFRPGSGAAIRAELGIPANGLVVLCAAAIKKNHKRVDYLLEEFAQFRRHRPELSTWLVVAGGSEAQTPEVMEMGRALLGDRVRFLVSYPRSRMAELYQAADIFALCSLREMFGIVLLEALATGVPCLVHRHPVMQWIVGGGGQAIDMATPGTLAAAMESLACDTTLRRRLGEEARRHCVAHFGRDRVVDQILDYYRFVLSHDSQAAPAESTSGIRAPSPVAEAAALD